MVFIESSFSLFLKNHVFFCFEFPWADGQEWQDQPDQPDQLVLAPWRCLGSAVVVKQTKHTVTKPCFQSASLWKSKTENNSWQTMVNLRVRTLSGGGEGGRWRCLHIRFHMVLTSLQSLQLNLLNLQSFQVHRLKHVQNASLSLETKYYQSGPSPPDTSDDLGRGARMHTYTNSLTVTWLFEDTLVPHSFQRTLLRLAPLHEKLVG